MGRHGMNCDTLRHPLLFRKDGELTIQPRKVTYDLDGNAEIDKSDPEHVCKMRLQGKGIELKKIDMITGNEILECFIEYKSSTKTLSIDNIRTHMGSKTQIIGEYDLAPDREHKNITQLPPATQMFCKNSAPPTLYLPPLLYKTFL